MFSSSKLENLDEASKMMMEFVFAQATAETCIKAGAAALQADGPGSDAHGRGDEAGQIFSELPGRGCPEYSGSRAGKGPQRPVRAAKRLEAAVPAVAVFHVLEQSNFEVV